jgi:DNA ligase-1
MDLTTLARTSAALADTRSRLKKTAILADCLGRLAPDEARAGVCYLMGVLPQGRIGVGPALLRAAAVTPAAGPRLALGDVQTSFQELAALRGSGVQRGRLERLRGLFGRATGEEQDFLVRLLLGELRQGALDGVMADAIARAADLDAAAVRRAAMLSGDLAMVASQALAEGAAGLSAFSLELFRPLRPMLAQPAEDIDEVFAGSGRAALEYKLDGARVQVHRDGPQVRVYTRQLHEVTARVPEVVEAVLALPVERVVLDGEAIALDPTGRPQPFQVTMQRFGRRLDVERQRRHIPLSVSFFDCLHRDGEDLIDRPASERIAQLDEMLPPALGVPRLLTGSREDAAAFLRQALDAGHEGIMAKSPGAAYQAGSRGADWLKIKPAHSLDLVVLAAEWGSGRRSGRLSNLHLGARDPATNGFVMLGKTFKGLTDALLEWQTGELLAREIGREGHVVHVRPELVVEVAFNELQQSRHYPAGLALRFARVKRYRRDKSAAEADTIETVRQIHALGFSGLGR